MSGKTIILKKSLLRPVPNDFVLKILTGLLGDDFPLCRKSSPNT